jgi:putative SOS response-associated peptidase YedK
MCGRYGRRGDKQRIAEWMQTHNTNVFDEIDEMNLVPSFNVAPQSFQPVVRFNRETGERELIVDAMGAGAVLVKGWKSIVQHNQR